MGNSHNFSNLDSVKVGCVRLSNQFFGADDGPVSAARYRQVQDAIRNRLLHAVKRIEGYDLAEAVGSSGTIQNLAAMAAAADQPGLGKKAPEARFLTYDKLLPLADRIRNCTLEERRALPGINPKRADVIVAGAAIVQTLMEELGVGEHQGQQPQPAKRHFAGLSDADPARCLPRGHSHAGAERATGWAASAALSATPATWPIWP